MSGGARVFRDARMSAALGVVGLVLSWVLLHDAYVARGREAPLPLRPFMWWR